MSVCARTDIDDNCGAADHVERSSRCGRNTNNDVASIWYPDPTTGGGQS